MKTQCPLCASSSIDTGAAKVVGIWKNEPAVFQCTDCRLYFLAEIPPPSEIKNLYSDGHHSSNPFRIALASLFRSMRCCSQYGFISRKIRPTGLSVLEVGASDGKLLSLLKERNSVTGLEYSTELISRAKERYDITLNPVDLFDCKGEYELIILSHVLEHFADLNRTVEALKSLLKKDGLIFIEVPHSPEIKEAGSDVHAAYLSTPHIYNFNIANLELVFKNHGFHEISTERVFYNLPPLGTRTLRRLGKSLVEGRLLSIIDIPILMLFALFGCISPRQSYKTIKSTFPWQGKGDSVRLIAKKK